MQTAAIISSTLAHALLSRRDPGLQQESVSSVSRWGDDIWQFDYSTAGAKRTVATIFWRFELPDGSYLTDRQHEKLLDALKRFVWSLLCAPGDNGAPLATTSMGSLQSGLRTFVRWMNANAYERLDQIDRQALERFKDDLPGILAGINKLTMGSPDDEDELDHDVYDEGAISDCGAAPEAMIGVGLAWSRLRIPYLLWRQRKALAKGGILTIPEKPWDPHALAATIANKAEGQILPVPAEVAVPLLNAAYRMLGPPADDVIRLTESYFATWDKAGPGGFGKLPATSDSRRYKLAIRTLSNFEFSVLPGEDRPWRAPLGSAKVTTLRSGAFKSALGHEIRDQIALIRNACTSVIQSTTGMRTSEVLSIPAGVDPISGLPRCVEVRSAISNLYEVFTVRSLLTKTEATPREQEWLLGIRLQGTDVVPPAVRAIQILDKLLEPFRRQVGPDAPLLVWFQTGIGLSRDPSNIGPMTNQSFNEGLKDFLHRNVDLTTLPDTSARGFESGDLIPYRVTRGRCIRPHQWRKTLAHFVFNTDNKLLPALSIQFKHISLAMTADDYLGHNQAMFQELDSARAQETAMLLFNMATGKAPVAGRMGQQLDEHIGEIRDRIRDLSPTAGWRNVLSFVLDEGIRLWFAPHGKCLPLSPAEMRCHKVGGTAHWLNKQPNYSVREPSLCAGCACFVLDERHADFWKTRFISNWTSWKEAERGGRSGDFRIILERANQARALLTRLGVDTDELERGASDE